MCINNADNEIRISITHQEGSYWLLVSIEKEGQHCAVLATFVLFNLLNNMIFSTLCIFSICTPACTHACTYTHTAHKQASQVTHNSLMDSSSPILSSRQKNERQCFFPLSCSLCSCPLCFKTQPSDDEHNVPWIMFLLQLTEGSSLLARGVENPRLHRLEEIFFLLTLCRFNPFPFAKSPCAPSVAHWSC